MIAVLGSGAFGTALAVALATAGRDVILWGRDGDAMAQMSAHRCNEPKLPGVAFPANLQLQADLDQVRADTLLLAVPAQTLAGFLDHHRVTAQALVACCKGVDLTTGLGPVGIIEARGIGTGAILTGPSFAADIGRGLPTALTLACRDETAGKALQDMLSTPSLRLYRTTDVTGAELGGALKNVMAIAAGLTIGAGLGESARAAIITRGFAELRRFAVARGARAETVSGLSGLGDLVLTSTSTQSRNFSYGVDMGRGSVPDPGKTVEGVATAQAVARLAVAEGIDMPVTRLISELVQGHVTLRAAIDHLMSRPLKAE